MSLKITNLRLQPHFPGVNELTHLGLYKNGKNFAMETFPLISNTFSWKISSVFWFKFPKDPNGPIKNNPALAQAMAWCQTGC